MPVKRLLTCTLSVFAAFSVLLSGHGIAFAAGEVHQLDPVVVTAEKQEQNIQEVPISVTAITSATIKDSGIKSLQDFSRQVPNLYIANWGMRGNSYVFVRGIGSTFNSPAVGFYVDDVNYMDSRVFDADLYDIERIEVLRGPQGTLYGRNSLGGVINVVTKKPGNEMRFGVEQTFGRYHNSATSAYVRAPLVEDKLFIGISGSMDTRDGYTQNSYRHNRVDDQENYSGRGQLRWTPTDKADITFSFDGEKVHEGVYPLADRERTKESPRTVFYDYNGLHTRESLGGSLRASFELPWFNVTSITSYRGYDDTVRNDQDFMPYDILRAYEDIEDRQFTQELRFSSPKDATSPFAWIGGLYAYHRKQDHRLNLDYGDDAVWMGLVPMTMTSRADSNLTTKGGAVFGQGTYTLFDKLDLTLGLRWEYEKNEMDYKLGYTSGGYPIPGMDFSHSGERSDTEVLPKAQIDYRWTENFMTYIGVARGYRSGGFNKDFLDSSDFSYDPEYSWNYEVGFKSGFFDNRLTINGAAFYIDLRDQQVYQVLPTASAIIRNAGKSRSMGFELEASALLPAGFQLDAGFGYTDMEYRQYSDKNTGQNYKGNSVPLAPRHTYNIALQHTLPLISSFTWLEKEDSLRWVNRFEIQGVGDFYWDDANTLKQSAYELLNLRSGLETENFSVTFWIKNLTDKKFETVAFWRDSTTALAEIGSPRTFGMTLRMDF